MKRYLILICAFFIFSGAKSQSISPQVIASAGDYYVGTNMTLSWTLGEIVTETFYNSTYILTQGFQQPNYKINAIEEPSTTNPLSDINIYPNPVEDQLNISFKDLSQKNVSINLYDLHGKVLVSDIAENTNAIKQLNMSFVARGNYILRFTSKDGKFVKSFKVVKY